MIELFQRNKIYDSAMGYKNNPQLVQNQAADFLLPQICPNRSKCFVFYDSFIVFK